MQTTVQSLEELARQSRINYTVVAGSPYEEYFRNMAGAEEVSFVILSPYKQGGRNVR